MSKLINDIVKNRALLDLSVEFMASREKLRTLKVIKKKHLIGCLVPMPELICAAGGYPVYPIRMLPFSDSLTLKALDLGQSLLGNSGLTKLLQGFEKYDRKNILNNSVHTAIQAIFKQYNRMFDIGIESGVPTDECYGIKVVTGEFITKGKNLSATVLQSIRCSAWQQCYSTWNKYAPVIYIDIPPYGTGAANEVAMEEVSKAVSQLEQITDHRVTNEKLRQVAEITNQCKDYSARLIKIALGDTYCVDPETMGEILSLLEICFQDYLSDPVRFLEILKNIVLEMEMKIRDGIDIIDVSDRPTVLFTSRFGGWDNIVTKYVTESGGKMIYADWFIYGWMLQIKTDGNMLENYAEFLQRAGMGFGPDNHGMVDHIHNFVMENKIDAVIYNQLFGCHSLTTAYTRLRKRLIADEIPSTSVSFNNVGENREQTKTRVVALMELLK